MKFRTIVLRGIRNFDEKIIRFDNGLNIVCGPNESGKSTIVDSLLYAVTEDIEDVTSLRRWNTDYSRIDLQYETDTRYNYTVSRTVYPEKRSKLEDSTIVEDPETISKTLQEHFGTINRVIFENSSVVKHNEMEILRKMDSKQIIREQIQVALTGAAERSTEDVIKYLEENINGMEKSLREVLYQKEECGQKLRPYTGIDEEYSGLHEKIAVYQGDLKEYQKKHESYTSRILYRDLMRDIQEIKKRIELAEDIESYIAALPFENVAEVETLQKERARINERMEGLVSLIKEREAEKRKLEQGLEKEQKGGITKWLGSLFGRSKKREEKEKKVAALEEILKGYRRDFYEMERENEDTRAAIKNLNQEIGSYRGKGLAYLNSIKDQYQRQIEELLQGHTKEEFINAASRKQQDADKLRSAMFRTYPELLEKDLEETHREKGSVEEKIRMLREEIDRARIELEDIQRKKEEKDRIQRSLNALNAQKIDLETKKEVDEVTLETIQSVYADLKNLFIPRLEEKAGRILNQITRGKYKSMSIRREDLDILIGLPDRTVEVTSLSQGTKDQLHLSLRIALSELLSGGRNLPLLFDESFYTSDEKRLNETFAVLKDIARTTQVILFTHNEDFLQHGNPIILESAEDTLNGAQ
jgi:DNA repair exonuclease SbcCD ATPase subunit